ncbi:T9SS type A sorting domain-containing protein [Winogradskyella maritima]|uniref:T9SS type A sorting domain-containing protein n=1 Tax=Winogradskyella maritima TaxID=1517766 RepID=A0ABV8ALE1_9FLAO|nr:T9SS type A sorting domain-containing protein [Winogradskyella maritima]
MKKLYTLILSFLSVVAFSQVQPLLDINDGSGSSSPTNFFVYNGSLYFSADDSGGTNTPGGVDLGRELWTTDGTAVGTTFVSDLRTGSDSSSPGNFFELGGTMYFSANSGGGNVLFSSDGTNSGTAPTGGGFVFNPTLLGGLIYYVNTVDANSLYEFNGTTQTQVTGGSVGALIGGNLIAYQDKIFCYMDEATDEPTIGRELYAYDPATDGFTLIKDVTGDAGDSGISNFTILGTDLYFEALGALWVTDGTELGTEDVGVATTAGIGGVNNLYAWNGMLFFEGDDGSSNDQLWMYNPTLDTVTNLSNITGSTATGGNNHDPSDFAPLGGFLYYAGEVSDDTRQWLFRTDGVTAERINDAVFDIDDIIVYDGDLYFEGDDGVIGNELYTLDVATLSVETVTATPFKIYPNPSQGIVTIEGDFSEDLNYEIVTLNGQVVSSGQLIDNTINHTLATGIYILKLKGQTINVSRKLIVD